MVVADFNGDGALDLAVLARSNVSIFFGSGDGTFSAAVSYGARPYPHSLAVRDFNGDGKADLAVANFGSNSVSILLGNGNGTFGAAVDYGAGNSPNSVAVGDFNGDGRADLAVADYGSNDVSILLGNGDGTFLAAANYGAENGPTSVAVRDFNGDGKSDLAVTNVGSDTVSILLGNGDGTFGGAVSYGAGLYPSSVAVGDFNGDGKSDLAVAGLWVTILINTCGGADVSISKTDGQTTAIAGSSVAYTITATNAGPSPAPGAMLVDTFPAALTGVSWTCEASAGSSCGTDSGSGNINQAVSLLSGGTVTFAATGTLDVDATGTLTNTATIAAPGGLTDPFPGNNSATDTDAVLVPADLSITTTDGQATATPGQAVTYTIVAANLGPHPANSATVTDTAPDYLTSLPLWTCVGAGGGTCTASGSGNINDTVNLPVGATVTYMLSATVSANPSNLRNTATVAVPPGMDDPNPSNNTATDDDTLLCFGETVVLADGRVSTAVIGPATTVWFGSSLKIGDSYSLEIKNLTEAGTPPGTITVYAGDDGCSGNSNLTVRDTTAIDPSDDATSQRVSFTATGTEPFFRVRLVNASVSSIPFSLSLADTTLYSPAWSTNGSFETFYSFQNTTAATLSGRLTLLDTAGVVLSTFNVSIPPGQTMSRNTAALSVVRNKTGTARFTHDGPPGAVQVEADIANFMISPAYVQPVKFQATREAR